MLQNKLTISLLMFSFFGLGTLLIGCSSPQGTPEDGMRWYTMHNCFACHGKKGNDGKAPQITGLDMSYRSFLKRLRQAETAIMPEYSKEQISDQDAADILAWLTSLK